MVDYRIEHGNVSHLLPLAANMREADRREVWASHRDNPYEALSRGLKTSARVWTAIVDERPVMMWGVARSGCVFSRKGRPWMLGTEELKNYWIEFLRQSRSWVARMQEGCELLENYVHGENRLSISWLRWCGFEISPEQTIIRGEVFYRFWRKA
ncbi:MAG: hypothetical protein LBV79_06780 [Candidatus Adiutrix sp.]|jgi:hypothetical protein|nr:hypothetical protein [Candidatus Adiutrix sp.]